MRSKAFGAVVAAVVGLATAGGCSQSGAERCSAIPSGTPVSTLPIIGPGSVGVGGPESTEAAADARCCYLAAEGIQDAGACRIDCAATPPAVPLEVGGDYAGGECGMDGDWECFLWARDGGVLGSWGFCAD
jgi:hypothetical protein